MMPPRRSPRAEIFICIGIALAFVDESVRKTLPGTPVLVTGVKDLCFFLAGFEVLASLRSVPARYLTLFAPWAIVSFASAAWVFTRFHSVLALGATVRTYSLAPLLFAVGYYMGLHEGARRRAGRILLIGGIAAIAVAIAQEHARGALPEFLTMRIYKERHSGLAGGLYNESLFASPQILGQVSLLIAVWSFAGLTLLTRGGRWNRTLLLFILSLYGVYLCRVRTAAFLGFLGILIVMLGGMKLRFRRGESPSPFRAFLVASIVLGTVGGLYWGIFPRLSEASRRKMILDRHFYDAAVSSREVSRRLLFFVGEIRELEDHDPIFGHGAGTAGPISRWMETGTYDIPTVRDSGLHLIYAEMGIIGLLAFLFCYLGLAANGFWRMIASRDVPPVAIPAIAVAICYLIWFLLKSHACIANSLSHTLWMGMMGIGCAALDRAGADHREVPEEASVHLEEGDAIPGRW